MFNRLVRKLDINKKMSSTRSISNPPILGFIGAGNITNCFISGLIANEYLHSRIIVSNKNDEKLLPLAEKFKIGIRSSNSAVAGEADIVFLAVKPNIVKIVCNEISKVVDSKRPVIVSLASVAKLCDINAWIGVNGISVIRTMTNMAIEIGKGTTVLFPNSDTTLQQSKIVESIFNLVGSSTWVDNENDLNTYAPLIGCGPAYVFLLIEAIQKAAMAQGIPKDKAEKISLEMVRGSAEMAIKQDKPMDILRKKVTTPNGITEHALNPILKNNIFGMFQQAFECGEKRCHEIDMQLSQQQNKSTVDTQFPNEHHRQITLLRAKL